MQLLQSGVVNTHLTRTSPGSVPCAGRSSLATGMAVRRQRRVWSSRVESWSSHGSAGLEEVTAEVLAAVGVQPGEHVVDLGCGTGQLSVPLALEGGRVLAVDVSPAMIDRLAAEASARELVHLQAMAGPIESLSLPPSGVDIVVSSYALHHLRDNDKAVLVEKAFSWLRPGGRLIIADVMLGRGTTHDDRAILAAKIKAFAQKGPGGWWRIAKNGIRFLLRIHERPISIEAWNALLCRAGFVEVAGHRIASEAGMVAGHKP